MYYNINILLLKIEKLVNWMSASVNHYKTLCGQGLQNMLCVDVYMFMHRQ